MSSVPILVLPDQTESCRARMESDPLNAEALGELREALRLDGGKLGALEALSKVCDVLDGGNSAESDSEPLRKPLNKAEHEGLVVHPREKQERRHKLASLLGRVLHLVQGDEAAKTVTRVCESGTDTTYPALDLANKACSGFLGVQPPAVYVARGEEPLFVAMLDRAPFLCVHHDYVAESNRKLSESELRFGLAHQLEHVKSGHTALLQISPERLEALMLDQVPFLFRTPIQLASKAVGFSRANLAAKKIGDWLPDNSRTAKVFDTVGDLLPDKDQETILPEVVHDWVRAWIQAVEYSADRAGLVACGSVGSAVSAIVALSPELAAAKHKIPTLRRLLSDCERTDRATADRIRELLRFAFSREYLTFAAG